MVASLLGLGHAGHLLSGKVNLLELLHPLLVLPLLKNVVVVQVLVALVPADRRSLASSLLELVVVFNVFDVL